MPLKPFFCLTTAAICALLVGCGGEAGTAGHGHAADHDHAALGPHGGHLIVLGEKEYHAELIHEETTHTVAVYLLDGDVKAIVSGGPPKITLQIFQDGDFVDHVLVAVEEEGKYSVTDEPLCDFLMHSQEVKGRVRVAIADKEFVGILEHVAHDHSGHAALDHRDEGPGHEHDH